jgi:hypothetical protein
MPEQELRDTVLPFRVILFQRHRRTSVIARAAHQLGHVSHAWFTADSDFHSLYHFA